MGGQHWRPSVPDRDRLLPRPEGAKDEWGHRGERGRWMGLGHCPQCLEGMGLEKDRLWDAALNIQAGSASTPPRAMEKGHSMLMAASFPDHPWAGKEGHHLAVYGRCL